MNCAVHTVKRAQNSTETNNQTIYMKGLEIAKKAAESHTSCARIKGYLQDLLILVSALGMRE